MPDEQANSGAPDPGLDGPLQIGDLITFNDLSSVQSSSLTGVGNTRLEETDGTASNQTIIDSPLFGQPAGTQINTGYALELTDGTNTYTVYAISFGPNNDDMSPAGAHDVTNIFTFEGTAPPEGVQLSVVRGIHIASVEYADIVCFTTGTSIQTDHGPKKIEDLRIGDLVWTSSVDVKELAPIRWIGRRTVSQAEVQQNPKLRPVRIVAGALGNGFPERDLAVSRQHRILLRSKIVKRITGTSEALIPAIQLTKLPGIFIETEVENLEYFHILFDDHKIIIAEGLETESLFPGRFALQSLTPAARAELFLLFPTIFEETYTPRAARPLVFGKKAKQLVARHIKNSKSCIIAPPKSSKHPTLRESKNCNALGQTLGLRLPSTCANPFHLF